MSKWKRRKTQELDSYNSVLCPDWNIILKQLVKNVGISKQIYSRKRKGKSYYIYMHMFF